MIIWLKGTNSRVSPTVILYVNATLYEVFHIVSFYSTKMRRNYDFAYAQQISHLSHKVLPITFRAESYKTPLNDSPKSSFCSVVAKIILDSLVH